MIEMCEESLWNQNTSDVGKIQTENRKYWKVWAASVESEKIVHSGVSILISIQVLWCTPDVFNGHVHLETVFKTC